MSEAVQIALIVSAGPTIAAISSLIVSLMNRRLSKKTAERLETVHQDVDGKMQQLLEAKVAQSHAAGEEKGREKAITERADRVTESERVEDRQAAIETEAKK